MSRVTYRKTEVLLPRLFREECRLPRREGLSPGRDRRLRILIPRVGRAFSVLSSAALTLAALVLVPVQPRADAYLSEDKVHYGADSYTIDYDKETVQAKGSAFFRKGDRSVTSDRIVIYYGKQEKRALFYDNVVVKDMKSGYTITGERAEARFARDYYRIEGNSMFEGEARNVRSSVIEQRAEGDFLFTGGVRYSDARYEVGAPLLRLREGSAQFEKGSGEAVEALDKESGDRIYCDSLRFDERSGDLVFSGDVLFFQGEKQKSASLEKSASLLVIRAEEIRYLRAADIFYISGNVYLSDGSLSLGAPEAEFSRSDGVLTARGGAIMREGARTVSSASMRIELDTKRLIFFDEAKGVFGAP
jgi:lipopolysaccharide assembly outer membrane protein LptD (OstA)